MWKEPRLLLVLLVGAALVCSITTTELDSGDHDKEGTRWRWPDEVPSRVGAGRLIPSNRQPAVQQQQGLQQPDRPVHEKKFTSISTQVPAPAPNRVPVSPPTEVIPPPAVPGQTAGIEPSTGGEKNASAVPLLKDAGKPGNPYILLNDIFPPQNSIRTKEQEAAVFNSLQTKDLGGLNPSEVYLADADLFVVRGYNYKKPYTADPPGPPISDYHAPAPNPPPPPEPGTVFYPSNETEKTAYLYNLFNPDFNSTNPADLPFFPFIPGGLQEQGPPPGIPPPGFQEDPNFFPFPFLPPPPPHWTEEKEFNGNEIRDQFQTGGQSFALFNGTQGPPPPSGLNGFPGTPPQFHGGNFQPGPPGGQQIPPGFPPGGPAGFPPGGPGGFPPSGSTSAGVNGPAGVPPGGPGDVSPTDPNANVTLVSEDEDVPFTPLFPNRPVEFYYPTHNTTAQPPGPFGPGIFVPPPLQFFAPRNESDFQPIPISPTLFRPPFNLPNYYQKQTEPPVRPIPLHLRPQTQSPTNPYNPYQNNQQSQQVPGYQPSPSIVSKDPTQTPGNTYPSVPEFPNFQNYYPGHYYQPPYSLEPPTYGIKSPSPEQTYPEVTQPNYSPYAPQYQYPPYVSTTGTPGISLEGDTNVNFRPQRPAIDPDSEIIDPARFHLSPPWSPYAQPVQSQKYESLGHQANSGYLKKPSPNFVTVYRIGGSYSYTLNQGR